MKQIAYLGWLGAGNLGDEGCFQLFRRLVRSISTQVECIPITIRESQGTLYAHQPGAAASSRSPWDPAAYDYVVLGGGSLLNADRYLLALQAAQAAGVPTAVWGTGFDGLPHELAREWIDGGPIPAGIEAPAPHPCAPQVLQACRIAGVRGPVTAAWLAAHGWESPAVCGDPGLLLDPPPSDGAAARDQLAVIWGMSHRATHQGTDHEALTDRTAGWLRRIARACRPVIAVMWAHDLPAAQELARRVGKAATLVEEPLTLRSFALLMSRSALTLSYRLHGCIFSAACGTAFCSIAYRSKCYDFARSVEAGEWVVEPGSPDYEQRLDRWFSRAGGREQREHSDRLKRSAARYRACLVGTVKGILRDLGEGE